ncbi:MAG: type II toxin-antitoxin system VapC family toxin [Gemmatimonadaceae bacterium]|nr:type II toxin-antitoxin system VapC family toxin [Gemmatimonadaceae bacterium]
MIASASICLDTDVCVDYLRRRAASGPSAFGALPVTSAWISAVTLCELRYGTHRSRDRTREDQRLADLLSAVRVRAFDARAAEMAASVRAQLEARGQRIGTLDTLIGAHALAEGAALMTRNVKEFARIEGLAIAEV